MSVAFTHRAAARSAAESELWIHRGVGIEVGVPRSGAVAEDLLHVSPHVNALQTASRSADGASTLFSLSQVPIPAARAGPT